MPLRKYGSETLGFTSSISIRNVPWITYSVKSLPLTEGSFFIRKQSPVGGWVLGRVQTHMCAGVARDLAPLREHYSGQWKIQLLLQFAVQHRVCYLTRIQIQHCLGGGGIFPACVKTFLTACRLKNIYRAIAPIGPWQAISLHVVFMGTVLAGSSSLD